MIASEARGENNRDRFSGFISADGLLHRGRQEQESGESYLRSRDLSIAEPRVEVQRELFGFNSIVLKVESILDDLNYPRQKKRLFRSSQRVSDPSSRWQQIELTQPAFSDPKLNNESKSVVIFALENSWYHQDSGQPKEAALFTKINQHLIDFLNKVGRNKKDCEYELIVDDNRIQIIAHVKKSKSGESNSFLLAEITPYRPELDYARSPLKFNMDAAMLARVFVDINPQSQPNGIISLKVGYDIEKQRWRVGVRGNQYLEFRQALERNLNALSRDDAIQALKLARKEYEDLQFSAEQLAEKADFFVVSKRELGRANRQTISKAQLAQRYQGEVFMAAGARYCLRPASVGNSSRDSIEWGVEIYLEDLDSDLDEDRNIRAQLSMYDQIFWPQSQKQSRRNSFHRPQVRKDSSHQSSFENPKKMAVVYEVFQNYDLGTDEMLDVIAILSTTPDQYPANASQGLAQMRGEWGRNTFSPVQMQMGVDNSQVIDTIRNTVIEDIFRMSPEPVSRRDLELLQDRIHAHMNS